MRLFEAALQKKNQKRPPVWFMRQAGRYHSHYQGMKQRYSFIDLCKIPEAACETTLGPIEDFDFDAAILFSDLLFPLEVMGMGLRYEEGPKLDWHLRRVEDLNRLKGGQSLALGMQYQPDALHLIRKALPQDKGLLGFVGAPLTLFCYAVEGTHKGDLQSSREGLLDGRYLGFFEKLVDVLVENMLMQARAGISALAVMDTCAGDFDPQTYQKWVVPTLKIVLERFKAEAPETPVIYYSKGTGEAHWSSLVDLPISGIGIDWNHDIAQILDRWSDRWAIQGNVDPNWLFLPEAELEQRLRRVFQSVLDLPAEKRRGWICGLGHGVLPKTPESNVRLFLKLQKEMFAHGE